MSAATANAALTLFAVAPQALGGVVLRCGAGPQRDQWLKDLQALLPEATPWRRMPANITDDALLGGLDLTATLAAGRPIARAGLLAQTAGGVVVVAMAERLSPARASRLASALDDTAAFAVVALDEGLEDEAAPAALYDRLALIVQPEDAQQPHGDTAAVGRAVEHARKGWRSVQVDDALMAALVVAADRLGIVSTRSIGHAVTVARITAALDGRTLATQADATVAARLVLAPRALRLPPPETPSEPPADPTPDQSANALPPSAEEANTARDRDTQGPADRHDERIDERLNERLDERITEAALAAIPPGLLAQLAANGPVQGRGGDAGRAGQAARSLQRGRPIGSQRGEPRGGARLALMDTLRAAAPWQVVRRQTSPVAAERGRLLVSREDLRVQRRIQQRATTTIFAIDASGSAAMHRLAEAKGAVELLLADCYARRDRVAVIGFRGESAQVLLAPTRSLVRAKRQLAGLPGGGGTPLASALDAVNTMAAAVRRSGATPLVVLLTDGSANIARGGIPGRPQAALDALAAAKALAATNTRALLIDTSPRASPLAKGLAEAMRATCLALPHAEAGALSGAVRQAQRRLAEDHV